MGPADENLARMYRHIEIAEKSVLLKGTDGIPWL
jgi:hypothetical protein